MPKSKVRVRYKRTHYQKIFQRSYKYLPITSTSLEEKQNKEAVGVWKTVTKPWKSVVRIRNVIAVEHSDLGWQNIENIEVCL